MTTFHVKNFEHFQHYKDRSPPWIKLYNEILDDYDFACLQDASKLHLISIWLLASRSDNKLPYDSEWIAKRINATEAVDLAALVASGFIVLDQPLQEAEQIDIKSLAECLPRDRGETEKRERATPRKSKLHEDWEPDQTDRDYAMGRRLDPDVLKTKFRDHHLAHGKTMVDWHAAWRTWCQNEAKWAKPGDLKPEPPPAAKAEARAHANQILATMIKKRMSPGVDFSPQRARELITAGLITADDATKVGCPING